MVRADPLGGAAGPEGPDPLAAGRSSRGPGLWAAVARRYLVNVLISLDQLGNALMAGDPDETISSRAAKARAKRKPWGCVLCAVLDRLDRDHCDRSLERDEGKRRVREILRRGMADGTS